MAASRESRWKARAKEHEQRSSRFLESYQENSTRLLIALVPDLASATLARLQELGFKFATGFAARAERDRVRLQTELGSLEESTSQSDGGGGEELEKLSEHYNALQPFLKKCFKHPRFDQLLLEGYGTEDYPKKFWHLSYYVDRRAAREIEEMCDGRSFASIRREAIQALEASKVLEDRIETLKEQRNLQEATEKRRKALQSRLESHAERWLITARRQLLEELEAEPEVFMQTLLEEFPQPAFEWRLAREIRTEHSSLRSRYLNPARELLDQKQVARFDLLLEEYDDRLGALQRFDQPGDRAETIDWKSVIYGESVD